MKKNFMCALLSIATMVAASCGGNNTQTSEGESKRESIELSGAGATFPLPFYNAVFEEFHTVNNDVVAYGGIGSGGGIRNLKDGIVDFAGSDAFLSDKEMSEMKPVVHIPTCMGAVVLAYNLPGVNELNLSGDVVADIFAGKITKWDDARIKELNPQAQLPSQSIIPVYRSDGSGTTFVFTDYLSKVSKEWSEKYGVGKSVNFPAGQAAKGNPGVAGVIAQTANSIGYVGSEYAFAQKIPYATLKNQCGELVKPTAQSISAAANGEMPSDTRTMITNSSAKGAYPISCFTWLVVYKEQNYSNRTKEQALATLDLIEFILSEKTQGITTKVHYAPLPAKAIELSRENLKAITFNGEALKK
ncbi:MAG: phosphate ABC transporter substrate-binding protein PstS [Muribaculaceae bacterium]|nr:phosphate ABC transporter substrate-binding protein PstS [Muribaculaceae bacterium]